MNKQSPIGITDSGVGGLTVVREVQRLLPGEDILYFGDSANCPYGNKTREQLIHFAGNMLRFLEQQGAKLTALACNTTSSMLGDLVGEVRIPLIGIIEPAARFVASEGLDSVGLISTEFTASSGSYDRAIARYADHVTVVSKGSPSLAALVDCGRFDYDEIDSEIRREMGDILSRRQVRDVILACTHYPIVRDRFEACYPDVRFIDPAREEALEVKNTLASQNLLAERAHGSLTIYTSGDPAVFDAMCRRLGIAVKEIISVKNV